MDRDEFLKQLDRWNELLREEAVQLFDKGVGADRLMSTAITIADARLAAEIRDRHARVLALPASAGGARRN
jgi:hypothetical protein